MEVFEGNTTSLLEEFDRQFEDPESVQDDITYEDAIAFMASQNASKLASEAGQNGQALQYLADWQAVLRNDCSRTYSQLRERGVDRVTANSDRELVRLNGIRRGVGMALRHQQKQFTKR